MKKEIERKAISIETHLRNEHESIGNQELVSTRNELSSRSLGTVHYGEVDMFGPAMAKQWLSTFACSRVVSKVNGILLLEFDVAP